MTTLAIRQQWEADGLLRKIFDWTRVVVFIGYGVGSAVMLAAPVIAQQTIQTLHNETTDRRLDSVEQYVKDHEKRLTIRETKEEDITLYLRWMSVGLSLITGKAGIDVVQARNRRRSERNSPNDSTDESTDNFRYRR